MEHKYIITVMGRSKLCQFKLGMGAQFFTYVQPFTHATKEDNIPVNKITDDLSEYQLMAKTMTIKYKKHNNVHIPKS